MKRKWILRGMALAMAVALILPAAGLAAELGEMDLYDPTIHVDEAPEAQTPAPASEEAPTVWTEPEAEPMPDTETAPDAEAAPDTETAPDAEAAPEAEPISEAEPFFDAEPSFPEELDAFDLGWDGAQIEAPEGTDLSPAELGEPDMKMGLGERYQLKVTLSGGESSDPNVVSVDVEGRAVVAKALGTAQVYVYGPGGSATRVVQVLEAPGSLSFGRETLTLGVGERFEMPALLPENTASGRITYASSDKSVVSVDASGTLTAKKAGTATIGAAAFNGVRATCQVQVGKAPSKLTLSPSKLGLNVGDSRALTPKLPSGTGSQLEWASSNPEVVTVDAAGLVQAVSAGTATVAARTFNGKIGRCKVVVAEGRAPTTLSLGGAKLTMGLKEKVTLTPTLGEGEGAVFAYSSSKKAVAAVSSKGVITAKKAGTAKITVKTHNGLKATVVVKVVKAPGKVVLSPARLSLKAGETGQLTAKLPSGTASRITWESSDEAVATVDAAGKVTAVAAGQAAIRAKTFNGKSALCAVTVTAADPSPDVTPDPTEPVAPEETPVPATAAGKMVANLRASDALGAKRVPIASVVELLLNNGFEPAFAAGVGANVYSEGTYGLFESSKYITNYLKRPRYFCYLDGGDYYTLQNGQYVLTAVYLAKEDIDSYTGEAEARQRFGEENYYRDNFSGKYVQDIRLSALETFLDQLAAGNWEGKFGIGVVQWTGGRTRKLAEFYRKHAGKDSDSLTAAQVVAAENEMILYDLRGSYASVYAAWKSANKALDTGDAAYSAGSLVCTKYEIPASKETKAVVRGNKAKEIYQIMLGE